MPHLPPLKHPSEPAPPAIPNAKSASSAGSPPHNSWRRYVMIDWNTRTIRLMEAGEWGKCARQKRWLLKKNTNQTSWLLNADERKENEQNGFHYTVGEHDQKNSRTSLKISNLNSRLCANIPFTYLHSVHVNTCLVCSENIRCRQFAYISFSGFHTKMDVILAGAFLWWPPLTSVFL